MNIPYGRQTIDSKDTKAALKVLNSDFLTQGPHVPKFEKKLSNYVGARYAVATNSATSALHIACLALGVKENDYVWTSPISFVASANCALFCGAKVDFVDIDIQTFNISTNSLAQKLEVAKKLNRLPKVLIPVHIAGQSCDMLEIKNLSKQYGFKILEDASHALGAKYRNSNVGSCQYSDITVFSFHPVKMITTGEGGALLTNNKKFFNMATQLRSHGITRDPEEMEGSIDGPWVYQQKLLGFNYRMTDFQAALGSSQLDKLPKFIEKRRKIADMYNNLLDSSNIHTPCESDKNYSSYHLYIIRIKNNAEIGDRKQVFEKLRSQGIIVNVHYIPIYKQPYYRALGFKNDSDFPNSEMYYSQAISLPIYPGLSEAKIKYVVSSIQKSVGHQTIF